MNGQTQESTTTTLVIIMAGGLGKRMNSNLPKVLHKIFDRPMLIHVIQSALSTNPYRICIVVGKYREIIESTINLSIENGSLSKQCRDRLVFIDQPQALGTGHAILCCRDYIDTERSHGRIDKVVILSGDVPFIKPDTINSLSRLCNPDIHASILATRIQNPDGYGRIILSKVDETTVADTVANTVADTVADIVEDRDCSPEEKQIKLINGGIYCFNCDSLIKYIGLISNNNAQQEYYLTDIFCLMSNQGEQINYMCLSQEEQTQIIGVNTPEQLRDLERSVKLI